MQDGDVEKGKMKDKKAGGCGEIYYVSFSGGTTTVVGLRDAGCGVAEAIGKWEAFLPSAMASGLTRPRR